jgi:hypothetical protein
MNEALEKCVQSMSKHHMIVMVLAIGIYLWKVIYIAGHE